MGELTRTPPFDLDAESSVIGSVLLDNNTFHQTSLQPEDFYKQAHKTIWKYICQMIGKGDVVDLLTLSAELKRDKKIDGIGGSYYLTQIVGSVPTAATMQHYAKIVHTTSLKRKVLALLSNGIENVFRGQLGVSEVIDANIRESMELLNQSEVDKNDIVKMGDLVGGVIDKFEASSENSGLVGIPSGYRRLDHLTGGWQKSHLIILGARPKMGKTSLLLNLAMNAADAGHHVGIISIEMTSEELVQRAVVSDSEIEGRRLERGCQINEDEWKKLARTQAAIDKLPIWINHKAGMTMSELRRKARKMVLDSSVEFLIIDYLGMIRPEKGVRISRYEHISETVRDIKILASELDIPIMLLSQLSRDLEKRPDKRPIPSDLRESGEIEQTANSILFLYRDYVYNINSSPLDAELNVSVARGHGTGVVPLTWRSEITKFIDKET